MRASPILSAAPAAILVLGVSLVAPGAAGAQDTSVHRLPPIITVTRGVERSTLELPFAISTVMPDSARPGQTHTQVEQSLSLLPGVTVSNRNNPSQDTRIVIRGFGARSQFGVRSIRVLRDGMPLTLPDGQTPIDYLDLESIGRIEVMRGTAAALYGNASGGVIDIVSAPPSGLRAAGEIRMWGGSDAFARTTALVSGTTANAWYSANLGYTSGDNFRDYSRQRQTNGLARVGTSRWGTDFALTAMGSDMPLGENPGSLTRAQADSAPRMADPLQRARGARKEVRQLQVGASASRFLDLPAMDGRLTAQLYTGTRSLYNPLTFAVVDLDRDLRGGSLRWSGAAELPTGGNALITVGYDHQWFGDDRMNHAACNGLPSPTVNCPEPGAEKGRLTLDQRETVEGSGAYLRGEVEFSPIRVSAGARADRIAFRVSDRLIANDRDVSGSRTLRAFSPMAGIAARIAPLHTAYVNYSTAFETPTTTELGNQPDGSAGFNPDLQPQYSTTIEGGFKGLAPYGLSYDLALFQTNVRDELIAFEVPTVAGRTYFRNAGRTRREGIEVGLSTSVDRLELAASYALSQFRFRDFVARDTVFDGNLIPGIPERQAQLSATWRQEDYFVVGEWFAKSKVWANDANTAFAPGYAVVNVRFGSRLGGRSGIMPMAAVNNVFDRRHISSVAINAAGSPTTGKFYEPGSGRSLFFGVHIIP